MRCRTIIKKNKFHFNQGFTIVEVIVACAIITVTIFALMTTAEKGIELSNRSLSQAQANTLLEEGAEAVISIRNNNWATISDLTLGTPYYLYFNTTTNRWSLDTSKITPNNSMPTYPLNSIFSRTIIISSVNRNSNDDISGTGTLDQGTKKITVSVSWISSSGVISKHLVFYLANIFN